MPALIPAIAGIAVKAGLAATLGATGAALAGAVVSFGLGQLFRQEPETPSFDFSDRARGLQQNVSNPVAPIPLIYGEVRLAGNLAFIATSGAENKTLHMVVYWGEGPIDGIGDIFFDDVPLTDSRYSGLVTVEHRLGGSDQTAIDIPERPEWTADHRLRGVAHSYFKMTYYAQAFSSIPVISAVVRGRTVIDPRDGQTKFSSNPALVLLDYLRNPLYGRGFDATATQASEFEKIDLQSFIDAANECDATYTYDDLTTEPLYRCDGSINVDRSSLDNIRDILTSMRGLLIFTGGKYRLRVDAQEPSSASFDESNIVGEWQVTLDGRGRRFNTVRARFVNKDREYQPDISILNRAAYITADNGTTFESTISLPMTTSAKMAARIAATELDQSRNTTVITFSTLLEGLAVEVGDVVSLSIARLNYVQKQFRVTQIDIDSANTVKLTCREYVDVYDPADLPSDTAAPPRIVLPPLTDVTDDIDIGDLTIPPQEYVSEYLYSFERGTTAADWSLAVLEGAELTESTDARVGTKAGLFTLQNSVPVSATLELPQEFVATSAVLGRRLRVQFWYKAGTATTAAVRLAGNTFTSDPQTIIPTATYQQVGFLVTVPADQTTLAFEVLSGAGTVLIDNIAVYIVPDRIEASTIENWIGPSAISSAYIADAAITTAKIQNAAIRTAQIGDLQVDTLQIADNAVTVPLGAVYGTKGWAGSSVNTIATLAADQPLVGRRGFARIEFSWKSISARGVTERPVQAGQTQQQGRVRLSLYANGALALQQDYDINGAALGAGSIQALLQPQGPTAIYELRVQQFAVTRNQFQPPRFQVNALFTPLDGAITDLIGFSSELRK